MNINLKDRKRKKARKQDHILQTWYAIIVANTTYCRCFFNLFSSVTRLPEYYSKLSDFISSVLE